MKRVIFLLLVVALVSPCHAQFFTDMLLNIFRFGRDETETTGISYPVMHDAVRRQYFIPDNATFPCSAKFARSPVVPDNVHRLRPGDIDVVAGLGDSLVAGSGALEEFAIGTFIEARGVSWCIGGQDNWRRYLTLPNILKVFNPNLTGYSTGTGDFISSRARFNIAFPVATTEDGLRQARILVQRIKSDPKINYEKHWKLITILFGANDICSAQCYNQKQFSPMRYAIYLRRTLDFLRAALPRTLVNLVPVIDVTVSARVKQSAMCTILHPLYCACMHQGERPDMAASKMAHLYQQSAHDLISSGRYDDSPDFTVVLQPFIKVFNSRNANPKISPPIDSSLVTYDCFHFSQKGHALGANLLWNNMMEPVGNKTYRGLPEIMEKVNCPTKEMPYIFTNVNSRNFWQSGSQDGTKS